MLGIQVPFQLLTVQLLFTIGIPNKFIIQILNEFWWHIFAFDITSKKNRYRENWTISFVNLTGNPNNGHSNSRQLVVQYLNTLPFEWRTVYNHLNTGLICYSDPHCPWDPKILKLIQWPFLVQVCPVLEWQAFYRALKVTSAYKQDLFMHKNVLNIKWYDLIKSPGILGVVNPLIPKCFNIFSQTMLLYLYCCETYGEHLSTEHGQF